MDSEQAQVNAWQSMARQMERIDCEGGAFDKVTREKVENAVRIHDVLQKQFTTFMSGQTQMQQGIFLICVLTAVLAVLAGGTLVWNVLRAVLHI